MCESCDSHEEAPVSAAEEISKWGPTPVKLRILSTVTYLLSGVTKSVWAACEYVDNVVDAEIIRRAELWKKTEGVEAQMADELEAMIKAVEGDK